MRSLALVLILAGAARSAELPPNVVLILADDLGFSDLGCYGSEIETPNLNRLAAGGIRFSQFYNTGRCWPTRASIMTGLYPHQARMAMNFGPDAPPAYSGRIPMTSRMIPELLKPRGYRSYHVGKWHLNDREPGPNASWPLGRGFDRAYFVANQENYFSPRLVYDEDRKVERPGGGYYATEALSDRAVDYLRAHGRGHADKPFFLYLAYTAPHFPLHALAGDVAHYRGRYRIGWDRVREARHRKLRDAGLVTCALSPRDPDAKPWESLSDAEKDEWDARMATHAAMIHFLDRGVGRVVKELEAAKSFENTLVLFLSDNGASAEYIVRGDGHKPGANPGSRESYRCLEVGWANAANTPFRMHKIWQHEGGISTPLIAHWPAGSRLKGAIVPDVGHVIDLLPTILEVAGAAYPDLPAKLPGRSLAPIFRGGPAPPREFLFWEHVGNRAVRKGHWKLVAEHGKPWELYDLSRDRSEMNDLASLKPARAKELEALWTSFARGIGVVDWDSLPQSKNSPSVEYRRK